MIHRCDACGHEMWLENSPASHALVRQPEAQQPQQQQQQQQQQPEPEPDQKD
jgi:hypothetical protein